MTCKKPCFGQLDPSLDATYAAVKNIFGEVNSLFSDELFHFGGDEVEGNCWDQRPEIKDFMTKNNISDYT